MLTQKDIMLNIVEVRKPELNAQLVADSIAHQLEGRIAFRRAMKKSLAATMKMGAVGMRRFGFTTKFLQTMFDQFDLWDAALEDICKRAASLKVKNFMYTPTEGEYVDENASLRQAIHQLVMGHHQSMLVTRQNRIVGVLKLTEVYREIRKVILGDSR